MTCLLIVAKAPVPGLAKTRLCPPCDPAQAADIAAAALLDTLDVVRSVPGTTPVVAMTGDLDTAARADELRSALRGILVFPQRGNDFADRLATAHADLAASCPGRAVLQIGMDTPQITPNLLGAAVTLLTGTEPGPDAVLGPAKDGGWWALGLRDPGHAEVLRDIPTSRQDTGRLTSDALRRKELIVRELPRISDVDTIRDAVTVAEWAPGTRFAAAVSAISSRVVVR